MNGIENITERILSDARAEAGAIRAEAEKQCAGIKASYDKAAQEEYWRLVKAGVKDCELRVQRLGKTAAMESRKSILALKQEMVSQAFDRAVGALAAMPEEACTKFLATLAAKASHSGRERVSMNERDMQRIGQKVVRAANEQLMLAGKTACLSLDERPSPIKGGLILREGNIEVNCGIETLTDQLRGEMAAQLASELFD